MEPCRNGLETIHLLTAIASQRRDDPRRHVHASCNPRAVHQPMLKQLPAVGVLAAAGKYNWALLMTKNSIRGTQRATCLRRRLSLSRKFFRTRLGHCRASTVCLPRFCAPATPCALPAACCFLTTSCSVQCQWIREMNVHRVAASHSPAAKMTGFYFY